MSLDPAVRCVILGGGCHAAVVIDALRAAGAAQPYAVLDHDAERAGEDVLGVPIRGGDEVLPSLIREGVTCFMVGLGGVGDNRPRRRLYEWGLAFGLTPLMVRHPSAVCSTSAQVGAGSLLLAAAVVNARAVLGVNVIVNTGAIVEHDCILGDHVHVATGARMASTVCIEGGAHVGAGATIRQCVTIGEGAVVGAGAVVLKDVEAWSVVVGVPARPLSVPERA